jgi:PAS domain S-box-containing protein
LKMEELLRAETSRWRMLVEQSRDGIVILDQSGRVFEANKRFADMLGYSVEETHRLCVWDWDVRFPKERLTEMIRNVDETGDHFETKQRRKDGTVIDVELSNNGAVYGDKKYVFCICRDVTDRNRAEKDKEELIDRLRKALSAIRTLKGILPICANCGRIKDETGRWEPFEDYLKGHSEAEISHGLCPDCAKRLYPDYLGGDK